MAIDVAKLAKEIIPAPTAIIREGLIVLGGVTIAAWVISRFPAWERAIQNASITVKDKEGNIKW